MRTIIAVLSTVGVLAVTAPVSAIAQGAGTGPVGTQCKADIAKFCKGMGHGSMEARLCLEANRNKVSAACRRALDTTGGGRGMGRNRRP